MPHSYIIKNVAIENVSTLKYLRIHVFCNLSWKAHVDAVTNKASKALGFIRRYLHSAKTSTEPPAYIAIVCSKIEYATLIWNPSQLYLINKLEAIQNKTSPLDQVKIFALP